MRKAIDKKIFLSSPHKSKLVKIWLESGKPPIVLVPSRMPWAENPAVQILQLGRFLNLPQSRTDVLKVLDFFSWDNWSDRDEWEREFTDLYPGGWYIMGDALKDSEFLEKSKIIAEAQAMSFEQLLARVAGGNLKLINYFAEITKEPDNEKFMELVENFHQMVDKLNLLHSVLKERGYNDCLYIENGIKTRNCIIGETSESACWVCPSPYDYYKDEFELLGKNPVPRGPVLSRRETTLEIFKTLGEKI